MRNQVCMFVEIVHLEDRYGCVDIERWHPDLAKTVMRRELSTPDGQATGELRVTPTGWVIDATEFNLDATIYTVMYEIYSDSIENCSKLWKESVELKDALEIEDGIRYEQVRVWVGEVNSDG